MAEREAKLDQKHHGLNVLTDELDAAQHALAEHEAQLGQQARQHTALQTEHTATQHAFAAQQTNLNQLTARYTTNGRPHADDLTRQAPERQTALDQLQDGISGATQLVGCSSSSIRAAISV